MIGARRDGVPPCSTMGAGASAVFQSRHRDSEEECQDQETGHGAKGHRAEGGSARCCAPREQSERDCEADRRHPHPVALVELGVPPEHTGSLRYGLRSNRLVPIPVRQIRGVTRRIGAGAEEVGRAGR